MRETFHIMEGHMVHEPHHSLTAKLCVFCREVEANTKVQGLPSVNLVTNKLSFQVYVKCNLALNFYFWRGLLLYG